MGAFVDLTNQIFGSLVVKHRSPENKDGKPQWVCCCDPARNGCGEICTIPAKYLRSKKVISCGCDHKPNLVGQIFGKLTVIKRHPKNSNTNKPQWVCKCSCDNSKISIVDSNALKTGNTVSCGCHRKEQLLRSITKHSLRYRPEYKIWVGIKQRCYNPKNKDYKDYGGRGIKMSSEWKESFEAFYLDMGSRPSPEYTIERKNNNLDYEAKNCRWATRLEQANNKRNSLFYEYRGEKKTLTEWCRELFLDYNVVYRKINNGWTFTEAIQPIEVRKITYDNITKTLREWCSFLDLEETNIYLRILRGEKFEDIIDE